MIVVTGATGQLGHAIVEKLLEQLPAQGIGVSVRDPGKANDFERRGVRVRQGDFDDGSSLQHAFEGATQVLIVAVNRTGFERLRQHRTAIEAARDAGARRILYTSHMGANPASPFPPMPDHAATEEMLRTSGVAFTSLRNGFYASSGVMLMGQALETGVLAAPQDGPVSWTVHADLVEAAALILESEGRFDGITPFLTGSEALDLEGLAALASELSGRLIKRVVITDEEHRANMVARGLPEGAVNMSLGLFAASRQGEFAAVDPALAALLGRPPTSMLEVLKEKIAP